MESEFSPSLTVIQQFLIFNKSFDVLFDLEQKPDAIFNIKFARRKTENCVRRPRQEITAARRRIGRKKNEEISNLIGRDNCFGRVCTNRYGSENRRGGRQV